LKPGRVFYGWWVLAASVVIELFGLGFGIFAITTVYPYVVETFPDWSRTTVFAPTSIGILTAGVMAPITGAIIDRFPIRALFAVGIVVQSTALYLFGLVQTPGQYFAVSLLFGLGLSGVTILPNQVLVSRWFHDRIGLVNGIILSATAMGAAISPALFTRFIESLGGNWREAFVWVALLAFAPPMLMVLFVVRDRPEAMGLVPYGAGRNAADTTSTDGMRLRDAARTVSFWGLAGTIFFFVTPIITARARTRR
jgi:sugar phosphate permease